MLKTISSLLLSMLVLLSSMGFFVDHMVCGMSGEHKLAINQAIEACSDNCEPSEENAVSRTCCDYNSFYFKEDVPATSTETKTKKLVSAFKFISIHELFADLNWAECSCFQPLQEPDILPSVERHILLQTFLI